MKTPASKAPARLSLMATAIVAVLALVLVSSARAEPIAGVASPVEAPVEEVASSAAETAEAEIPTPPPVPPVEPPAEVEEAVTTVATVPETPEAPVPTQPEVEPASVTDAVRSVVESAPVDTKKLAGAVASAEDEVSSLAGKVEHGGAEIAAAIDEVAETGVGEQVSEVGGEIRETAGLVVTRSRVVDVPSPVAGPNGPTANGPTATSPSPVSGTPTPDVPTLGDETPGIYDIAPPLDAPPQAFAGSSASPAGHRGFSDAAKRPGFSASLAQIEAVGADSAAAASHGAAAVERPADRAPAETPVQPMPSGANAGSPSFVPLAALLALLALAVPAILRRLEAVPDLHAPTPCLCARAPWLGPGDQPGLCRSPSTPRQKQLEHRKERPCDISRL